MCHSFFSTLQDPFSLEDLFHLLLDKIEVFEIVLLVYLRIFGLFFNLSTTGEIFLYFRNLCCSLFDDHVWDGLRNFLDFILVLCGKGS